MKKAILSIFVLICAASAWAFHTDTIKVATQHLETAMDVTVIVPDKAAQGQRFPTVYLLNGYGGDHRAWGNVRNNLGELADNYGMVMVMPDGRDSWYWDSPVDPKMQMETFFMVDLVPYIDKHYPTIDDASKRAITGLSMGGHGALWLAVRHPNVFGLAGSTSGGVNILPFPGRWRMAERLGAYEGNEQVWREHTVASLIPLFKNANLKIIFDCGADDFFAEVNDRFHHELLNAKVPHEYISRPGNHSGAYWKNSILYHLLFFSEAFNK
ncbi:MAG: esterase family protein [Muribaculaceae bacterium]|nr:esterase family protein [Muribaculaceae bacterium]